MHPKYTLIPLTFSLILAVTPTWSAGPNGRQPVQPILNELNQTEIDDLTYMREEERLARDVYMELSAYWGDQGWPVLLFDNIAQSEQTQMETLKSAMDRYGLPDPSDPDVVGVYADSSLNDLYKTLMEDGTVSYMGALYVGALIEEVDIADLDESIARTDNPDLQTIYANLQRGSRNHLRAFVAEIERLGGDAYEAQALEQETVDAILDAPMERGGQGRRGENGQGKGQGQGRDSAGAHSLPV